MDNQQHIDIEAIINKAMYWDINPKLIHYLLEQHMDITDSQKELFSQLIASIQTMEQNAQISSMD